MKTQSQTDIQFELTRLGFSLTILSGPTGTVSEDHPQISYTVRLSFGGTRVLDTDYHLGVGHINLKRFQSGSFGFRFTTNEIRLLEAWQSKPGSNFKDKQLWADAATKVAKQQDVKPELADVLHCLLLDGQAFFNRQTFEEWASDFGYDTDSRKAEAIYKACDDTGRALSRLVPEGALTKAQELLQDH